MKITKMLAIIAASMAGLVGFSWMVPAAEAGGNLN
jgi:hypothetical protein